jgi:hypothetical protein
MLGRFILLVAFTGSALSAYSQEPWDIARTTIEGKKLSIEYGRPNLKERTLADLMKQLPADRIWRAGSGPMTIFSTEADLLIGGKKVPAGNYSLYMYCPVNGDYALIINKDLGEQPENPLPKATSDRSNRPYPHFMDYTGGIADKEVARIPLKKVAAQKTQVLIYEFESVGKGAVLKISWGEQSWTVDLQP